MREFTLAVLLVLLTACTSTLHRNPSSKQKNILLFGKTTRAAHINIIPGAIKHLVEKLQAHNLVATGSQDTSILTKESLSKFDAIILIDVSSGVLSDEHKVVIEDFVSQGKGLIAIHASIAAGNDWVWFREMIGTTFLNHPPIQPATVSIAKTEHPAVRDLDKQWVQSDEWYNFTTKLGSEFEVLVTVDESSYNAGNMRDHPVTWCRRSINQKVWFTAMGHDEALYADHESPFMKQILAAVNWIVLKD